jgi:hypothetical protein
VRSHHAITCALVGALILAACKRGGDTGTSGTAAELDAGAFDKSALLAAFGQCALGTYRDFNAAAVELDARRRGGHRRGARRGARVVEAGDGRVGARRAVRFRSAGRELHAGRA